MWEGVLLSINTTDTLINHTESPTVPTIGRNGYQLPSNPEFVMELPLYLRTSPGCPSLVFQGDYAHLTALSQVPDLSSVEH